MRATANTSSIVRDDVPGVFHLGHRVRDPGNVARAAVALLRAGDWLGRGHDRIGGHALAVSGWTHGRRILCHAADAGGAARSRRRAAVVYIHPNDVWSSLRHFAGVLALLYADDGADQLAFLPADERSQPGFRIDPRAGHGGVDRGWVAYRIYGSGVDCHPDTTGCGGVHLNGYLLLDAATYAAAAIVFGIQIREYFSSGGL